MVNAGRILILAQGEWSNLTNYNQLDLVTYNDIAYLARQASVGVNPSTDLLMTYWQPFGSAATIATTSKPGLVMPDGTTITIAADGTIAATLGVSDLSNVVISNIANGQVLKYNSTSQKWENQSLGTAASKNSTNAVTQSSTDLVESGAVYATKTALEAKIGAVTTKTLSANATSLQFDVPTSGDHLIDFFISDGSFYTAIDLSVSGKAALTFKPVASSRTVSCRISDI